MQLNIPAKVRVGLYVFTAISAPIMAYLLAKGYIGQLEVSLYSGLVTAVNAMAALKVKE